MKPLFACALVLLFVLLIGGVVESAPSGPEQISVEAADLLMSAPGSVQLLKERGFDECDLWSEHWYINAGPLWQIWCMPWMEPYTDVRPSAGDGMSWQGYDLEPDYDLAQTVAITGTVVGRSVLCFDYWLRTESTRYDNADRCRVELIGPGGVLFRLEFTPQEWATTKWRRVCWLLDGAELVPGDWELRLQAHNDDLKKKDDWTDCHYDEFAWLVWYRHVVHLPIVMNGQTAR